MGSIAAVLREIKPETGVVGWRRSPEDRYYRVGPGASAGWAAADLAASVRTALARRSNERRRGGACRGYDYEWYCNLSTSKQAPGRGVAARVRGGGAAFDRRRDGRQLGAESRIARRVARQSLRVAALVPL
jgi:hypothetical protein